MAPPTLSLSCARTTQLLVRRRAQSPTTTGQLARDEQPDERRRLQRGKRGDDDDVGDRARQRAERINHARWSRRPERPADRARHRVAVWRELRRGGAIPLAAGTWALPATPLTFETVDKVQELIGRAPGGELLVLEGRGRDGVSEASLRDQYTSAREAEWVELLADCAKFHAEIDREIAKQKFTLAELEEEEQSLDRLRRWHRDLALRDTFGAASADLALVALKESTERLDDYAERVYRALGQ